jgi:lipopolysaccharide transport system ATP-binding protein
MADIAVRVQGIYKRYRIGQREPYKLFREVLSRSLAAQLRSLSSRLTINRQNPSNRGSKDHFWALQDVSFEVHRGEALGIIGQNGSGKSTLLKILSRITLPTKGRAEMHGRMASLLDVGTGFHPELSGRENIFLNGAILGMKRAEIERKLDEIIGFAEVEKFVDTPVKHYSSGMYLRLAFAVAAHLDPEILLIDEVLAVGDAAFQKKCLGKMGEVTSAGRTVLFVSHNLAAVQQLTQTSIWIDHGKLAGYGRSDEVISQYLRKAVEFDTNVYDVENTPRRFPELRREVQFLTVELEGYPNQLVPNDGNLCLKILVRGNEFVDRFRFGITICQLDGTRVGTVFGPETHALKKGEIASYRMELHDLRLAPGGYSCVLFTGQGNQKSDRIEFDLVRDVLFFEVLSGLREDGAMSEWLSVWGPIQFIEPTVERINQR